MAVEADTVAVIETKLGKLVVEFYDADAPKTVTNFRKLTKDGFYNGTIFHRVIPGFMIQGGGFMKDMSEKPTASPILNEAKNGLKNLRGTIAMARRGDPNSATSQFFINHVDNSGQLDDPLNGGGYAVFGKVTQGMDVVDRIARVPTSNGVIFQNVPVEPVVIQSVKIIPDKK